MPSYKIKFKDINQNAALSEMLGALERGFQQFSIDYYLVGAVSRDVWMSGLHNLSPRRTTGDVDFAVFINDKGVYEQLKDYLMTVESFNGYKENAFVLIYKDGTEVDLMPFGAVEDENRKVTIKGTGFTSIHVEGLKEVYEQSLPEINIEGHRFKFCSLPGIVILKLIAWDDRPEVRTDDIRDVSDILQHFFTMYQDVIWEKHNDLFEQQEDLLLLAARVLGREIRAITISNQHLHGRISGVLERSLDNSLTNKMAVIMRAYFDNTIEDCTIIINEIFQGLIQQK